MLVLSYKRPLGGIRRAGLNVASGEAERPIC